MGAAERPPDHNLFAKHLSTAPGKKRSCVSSSGSKSRSAVGKGGSRALWVDPGLEEGGGVIVVGRGKTSGGEGMVAEQPRQGWGPKLGRVDLG